MDWSTSPAARNDSGCFLQVLDFIEQIISAVRVKPHEFPVIALVFGEGKGAQNPFVLGVVDAPNTPRTANLMAELIGRENSSGKGESGVVEGRAGKCNELGEGKVSMLNGVGRGPGSQYPEKDERRGR